MFFMQVLKIQSFLSKVAQNRLFMAAYIEDKKSLKQLDRLGILLKVFKPGLGFVHLFTHLLQSLFSSTYAPNFIFRSFHIIFIENKV